MCFLIYPNWRGKLVILAFCIIIFFYVENIPSQYGLDIDQDDGVVRISLVHYNKKK